MKLKQRKNAIQCKKEKLQGTECVGRKKRWMQSVRSLLLVMVFFITGLDNPVRILAETQPTSAVIDEAAMCSVTVVKYEDFFYSADDPDASLVVGSPESQKVHKPMAEAGYALYRIAGLRQVVSGEEEKTISLDYESYLRRADGTIIEIPSGLSSTEDLSKWVMEIRESTDPSKQAVNIGKLLVSRGRTNGDGILVFDQLPVGVYMLYEDETPSNVIRTENQCVVLTLPTTAVVDGNDSEHQKDDSVSGDNMAGDASYVGQYWDYDVVVRPKNDKKDTSIEKHIQVSPGSASIYDRNGSDDPSNDILTDTEDYQIGDTICYWVSVDVPEKIGELRYFYLVDRISKGQTFIRDIQEGSPTALEVWGRRMDGTMEPIPHISVSGVENWRVTEAGSAVSEAEAPNDTKGHSQKITTDLMRTFGLYFNTQSLSCYENQSLHKTAAYSKLYIRFRAILNEQAIIGGNGNENDIALKMSHRTVVFGENIPNEPSFPSSEEEIDTINPQCIDTRVYTYEVSLLKKGEGIDSMEGAEFELRDSEGKQIKVSHDERGYYTQANQEGPGEVIRVGSDGMFSLRGLRSGVYELVETKTLPGYNLLKNPIQLTIESEADYFPFEYQENPSGEYFRIQEGMEYYILKEKENGKMQQVLIDLEEMTAGDYIRLSNNQPVYQRSAQKKDQNSEGSLVTIRYTARGTDSESMHWKSNYGMDADGVIALTVYNRKGLSIPSTGGQGTILYTGAGAMLILFSVIVGIRMLHRRGSSER